MSKREMYIDDLHDRLESLQQELEAQKAINEPLLGLEVLRADGNRDGINLPDSITIRNGDKVETYFSEPSLIAHDQKVIEDFVVNSVDRMEAELPHIDVGKNEVKHAINAFKFYFADYYMTSQSDTIGKDTPELIPELISGTSSGLDKLSIKGKDGES